MKKKIAEGVGIAVLHPDQSFAARLEKAMAEAVLAAHAIGASDPAEIKRCMLEAHARAKKEMERA
jgi:hypothetical protein